MPSKAARVRTRHCLIAVCARDIIIYEYADCEGSSAHRYHEGIGIHECRYSYTISLHVRFCITACYLDGDVARKHVR